jgi:hypothetical protein
MFKRQPPSLLDSARHVLFHYTLHIDRFELTAEKTYEQFVYAVRSNRVPRKNLFPPEYPSVRLFYRYQRNSPFKFHSDCPGLAPWDTRAEREYASVDEVLSDLFTDKDHFWCHHCERGLFFPNTCPDNAIVEEEEENVEVDNEE